MHLIVFIALIILIGPHGPFGPNTYVALMTLIALL
jgi:hypothetical protein